MDQNSERSDFRSVAFIALAGFQCYRPNLKKLREKLYEEKKISDWKTECHREFLDKVEMIHSGKPIGVEEQNGWRYIRYLEGLVSIEAVDNGDVPIYQLQQISM